MHTPILVQSICAWARPGPFPTSGAQAQAHPHCAGTKRPKNTALTSVFLPTLSTQLDYHSTDIKLLCSGPVSSRYLCPRPDFLCNSWSHGTLTRKFI